MNLPKPLPHPRALAHLGDAVYELWIREAAIEIHTQSGDLHQYSSLRAQADTQCQVLERLIPTLSLEEMSIVKRAQNIQVPASRRSIHTSYRKATALEALIGYWYIADPEQLAELKTQILCYLEEILRPNPEA